MPNLIPGQVKRTDKNPSVPANAWGKFISGIKQLRDPQDVKAVIEDRVGSNRDKQAIMTALEDLCDQPEAIAGRKARKGHSVRARVR